MNDYERHGEHSEQNIESRSHLDSGVAIKLLLIGMGIGAAVALLATPMSGREARNALRQGLRNAFDGINQQTRNLRHRGSNLLGFNRRKVVGGGDEDEYEQGAGI